MLSIETIKISKLVPWESKIDRYILIFLSKSIDCFIEILCTIDKWYQKKQIDR